MQANRLVVFDLDGTLYRTDLVTLEAVRRAAAEHEIPVPQESTTLASLGLLTDEFCRTIFTGADSDTVARLADAVRRHERELIPECAETYEGVCALLERLAAAGLPLAICSNGRRGYVDAVLETTGIAKYFSDIEPSMPGRAKPGALKALLERHPGCPAILVGDTMLDEEAACRNAIPFIAAGYGFGAKDLAHCGFIADSPLDILGYVNRWRVFTALEERIAGMKSEGPLIAGISGPDCAGKTRFAAGLKAHLKARGLAVSSIHVDDFHNPRTVRHRGEDEIKAYIDNAFNLQLLVSELLEPIKRLGQVETSLTLLDLESDGFTNEKHWAIGEGSIVVLEGSLLFRPPVDEYVDLRIVLDVDFEEVLRRAVERDWELMGDGVVQRYREKYIPVQKRYMYEFKPLERADVVVDNNDWDRPVAEYR